MGAEIQVGAGILTEVPAGIRDHIAHDPDSMTLYVEKQVAGSPAFLTWHQRNEDEGIHYKLILEDPDQVAKRRQEGFRVHSRGNDAELDNLHAVIDLLCNAAKYGASEVHFLLKGSHAEIQLEVNSELKVLERPPMAKAEMMVQTIYQGLATDRDNQWKPLEFQNATISGSKFPPDSGIAFARVVRGPSYPQHEGGQFMTVRLQYFHSSKVIVRELKQLESPRAPEGIFLLSHFGYEPSQIEKVNELMAVPAGAIFVSGPVGAGKTNTIVEIMRERARRAPDQRQIGVEDPVENSMPWMTQLSVNNTRDDIETGRAFADRIRVMLRMAPRHLMVGEIRGPAAAHAALEAAITGLTLIASIHSPDAFLFAERIASMDRQRLDPRNFCDHTIIIGSISQRLVPVLCPDCREPLTDHLSAVEARIVRALDTWGDMAKVHVKGHGCKTCSGEGVLGRKAVAEVVLTDADLMKDLVEHGSEVARRNYRSRPDADKAMLETALQRVFAGNVDPRSVEKMVAKIASKGSLL